MSFLNLFIGPWPNVRLNKFKKNLKIIQKLLKNSFVEQILYYLFFICEKEIKNELNIKNIILIM